MFCPNCGTQNLENASFCSKCGKNLSFIKTEIDSKGITTIFSKKRSVLLMIFFMVITLGLYYEIWFLRRLNAINNMKSKEKLGSGIFVLAILLSCISLIFSVMSGYFYEDINLSIEYETYSKIIDIIVWIIIVVQCFKVRHIFDDHFNVNLNRRISFSKLATFFFGIFYLQYKINRFNESDLVS